MTSAEVPVNNSISSFISNFRPPAYEDSLARVTARSRGGEQSYNQVFEDFKNRLLQECHDPGLMLTTGKEQILQRRLSEVFTFNQDAQVGQDWITFDNDKAMVFVDLVNIISA